MKVLLTFLSKLRLNKIRDSFVLNLHLFSFFCLLTFFIKAFYCTLGFSFASADLEKKIFLRIYLCKKYLRRNQGVLATWFTTSRTVLNSVNVFMLNEKQLFTFFTYFYCFHVKVYPLQKRWLR